MIVINYFLVMILLIMGNAIKSFDTLPDIKEYAATHEEFPKSDNEDWLDPSYTTFHQQLHDNFFTRLARSLGLEKKSSWTPAFFDKLLNVVVEQREKQKLSGRYVARVELAKPAKLYIWGDLHGAFHSLVRDLDWLQKKNIITEDLKIVNPDHYFVFNGDAIDRSPYILETLSVLLLLLERNEKQVFYIRGKHEDEGYWQNFGLKRELRIRIPSPVTKEIPLGNLVSRLFNTLPLALYISTDQDPTKVIRISHSGRDNLYIDEEYFGDFWNKTDYQGTRYYDIRDKKESEQPISVEAIIRTEDWMDESRTTQGEPKGIFGLGLLEQERGAMAWAILSSPIMPHKVYFNFYYDAFAVVDVPMFIDDSTITLHNQNLKKKGGFKETKTFNLVNGIEADLYREAVVELTIGSTLALVSGVPTMGKLVKRGMSARIREENQSVKGKINYHIKLIIYNDNYIPHLARKNIIRLIEEDKVDIILCPTGSPTLFSYIDYIKENKILTLFPVSGSNVFRHPDLTGLINFRETYSAEVRSLIEYVMTEHAARRFAFFYQNDAYGVPPLKAAQKALKKSGITEWTEIGYLRGSADFSKQAQTLWLAQPDSIGFFSTAASTQEFIRQLGIEFLANKVLFGISFLGEAPIREYTKRKGIPIYWGAVVPNPQISQYEIVQEYRKAMDRNHYRYDVFSLEAYIGTSILMHALQNIELPVTREKIKKQLESFKHYDFKGLTFTFNPETRGIFDKVWIETAPDEEWMMSTVKPSLQSP
ncbi:MAG: ABC transporter substrate-binding protein [Candidatus Babeliales bacterium]